MINHSPQHTRHSDSPSQTSMSEKPSKQHFQCHMPVEELLDAENKKCKRGSCKTPQSAPAEANSSPYFSSALPKRLSLGKLSHEQFSQTTEKSRVPPAKPPRAKRNTVYVCNGSAPPPPAIISEFVSPTDRTLEHINRNVPFSQRHKPSLLIDRTSPEQGETLPTVSSNGSNSDNKEKPVVNPYPWRETNPSDALPTSTLGVGFDLELSLEPRNISRVAIRSPSPDKTEEQWESRNLNGNENEVETRTGNENRIEDEERLTPIPYHLSEGCSSQEQTPEVILNHKPHPYQATPPITTHFDKEEPSNRNSQNEVETTDSSPQEPSYRRTRSPTTQETNPLLETGVYNRLEDRKKGTKDPLFVSGVYDQLQPLADWPCPLPMTQEQPTTLYDSMHKAQDTPLGSSTFSGETPPTSPHSRRTHTRRRSEDLSELSIAKERQMTVSPVCLSPEKHRRKSAHASPDLHRRQLPLGVEESMGWQFLPKGYLGSFYSTPGDEKQKKSKWTWFGTDKTKNSLFYPKKISRLQKCVSSETVDVNAINVDGNTPLHCYIKQNKPEMLDFIATLLVHCNINKLDIDKGDRHGNSPLHIATQCDNVWAIKYLLAFGANIDAQNQKKETPLDLLSSRDSPEEVHELFMKLYALPGGKTLELRSTVLNESLNSIINMQYQIEDSEQLGVYLTEKRICAFVFKLEQLIKKQELLFSLNTGLEDSGEGRHGSSGTFFDPMIARQKQEMIIRDWKSTLEFKHGAGSRILFLDGGGIRGLIQIEVLALIRKLSGREIIDLFDWIVGTSTGGILALCLVYGEMNLAELRQMYFQLREEVFGGGIMSTSRRTEALEEILKRTFKGQCMSDRLPSSKCPRVLISAVSTKTNPPRLHFFNNCFDDQYSRELVWKVARYTSAGPTYFLECDNYVDGGVMANNPSMEAWLEITKYFESRDSKPNFAMAVSIGTGIYPPEKLGEVDFFSKGLFDLRGTLNRAKKLIKMLSTALVESERVAEIFSRTCDALDTNFFRFSPALSHPIRPDETDMKVLVDMIIQTKAYLLEQECKTNLDKMIRLFKHITEISRGLNLNT